MREVRLIMLVLILIIASSYSFSQSDMGYGSLTNVNPRAVVIQQERELEKNSIKPVQNAPAELLNRLEIARINENTAEAERLNAEIQKYSIGTRTFTPMQDFRATPVGPNTNPPFTPDWNTTDVTVFSGYIAGAYNTANFRVMDMKTGKDGNMYAAFLSDTNVAGANRYVWVYRSTNSGANWNYIGGAYYTGYFLGGVSLSIDRRDASNNDSTKISVYYTVSSSSSGTDAGLSLLSFTVSNYSGTVFIKSLATPTTGRKLMYPSSVTDGQYYSTATYIGCVFTECSNSNDSVISIQMTRTINWHNTYTTVSLPNIYTGTLGDYFPSACLKRSVSGSDSVYIAVERRFSTTNSLIRVLTTTWSPSATNNTLYIPPTGTGLYTKPCLNIRQTSSSSPRNIVITYAINNVAKYACSTDDGASWNIDYNLDLNFGTTTTATWCSSDTLTSTGCFTSLYKAGDSICVRRGFPGSMGTTQYKVNSHQTTTSRCPVCVTYRSGTLQRAVSGFPGLGPQNIYCNAENLPTGIVGNGTIPNSFKLSQNYPNPFNPATSIIFSIPKSVFVKITVYDVLGKEIKTILSEQVNAGTYNINFDASSLSSGIYFYKINAGPFSDIKKMMLVK